MAVSIPGMSPPPTPTLACVLEPGVAAPALRGTPTRFTQQGNHWEGEREGTQWCAQESPGNSLPVGLTPLFLTQGTSCPASSCIVSGGHNASARDRRSWACGLRSPGKWQDRQSPELGKGLGLQIPGCSPCKVGGREEDPRRPQPPHLQAGIFQAEGGSAVIVSQHVPQVPEVLGRKGPDSGMKLTWTGALRREPAGIFQPLLPGHGVPC